MRIGCPKEIKNKEYRVGLIPSVVSELVTLGHSVSIQQEQELVQVSQIKNIEKLEQKSFQMLQVFFLKMR